MSVLLTLSTSPIAFPPSFLILHCDFGNQVECELKKKVSLILRDVRVVFVFRTSAKDFAPVAPILLSKLK